MTKRMRIFILTIFILISQAFGQLDSKEDELKKRSEEGKDQGFKKGAIVNLSLNQVNFSNWAAGGNNSISASTLINFYFYYKKDYWIWDNNGSIGYGILNQENADGVEKTDDRIDFTSKIGYKAKENLYYAMLWNFRTQMAPGYTNPGDDDKISDIFAPLYVTGSLGMDYKKENKLSVFASILSTKMTFVMDQTLADGGAFGVDAAEYDDDGNKTKDGKKFKGEFGGYIKMHYQDEIFKNVQLISKIDLFSNYLEKPQNVDVNLEVLLNMKVNKYLSANISTYMIYDDDINIVDKDKPEKKASPKLQFKEILGIGLSFTI